MKRRSSGLEWRKSLAERQENVLPLNAARNEGKFLAAILGPKPSLNTVQRVGVVILAFPFLLGGLIGFGFILSHPEKLPFFNTEHPLGGTILNLGLDLFSLALFGTLSLVGFRLIANVIRSLRSK